MADTITADEIFIPSGGYIQFTDESRGHLLALDYDGKTVTKFDIFSGETLESKEFLNKIKKIKFYDNGYYFVFSNSDSIYVYDEYFELKDTINVGRSFFDFEFGHDGYLYFIC